MFSQWRPESGSELKHVWPQSPVYLFSVTVPKTWKGGLGHGSSVEVGWWRPISSSVLHSRSRKATEMAVVGSSEEKNIKAKQNKQGRVIKQHMDVFDTGDTLNCSEHRQMLMFVFLRVCIGALQTNSVYSATYCIGLCNTASVFGLGTKWRIWKLPSGKEKEARSHCTQVWYKIITPNVKTVSSFITVKATGHSKHTTLIMAASRLTSLYGNCNLTVT